MWLLTNGSPLFWQFWHIIFVLSKNPLSPAPYQENYPWFIFQTFIRCWKKWLNLKCDQQNPTSKLAHPTSTDIPAVALTLILVLSIGQSPIKSPQQWKFRWNFLFDFMTPPNFFTYKIFFFQFRVLLELELPVEINPSDMGNVFSNSSGQSRPPFVYLRHDGQPKFRGTLVGP